MHTKDELLLLIESLNQTEKRYFKIFAKRHVIGKSNAYLDLFEAAENAGKKGNYNEDIIRKQLIKVIPSGSFAVIKHYLYNLILRSMRAYHENDTVSHTLTQRMIDVEFLMQKGLFEKALKIVAAIKSTARTYNRNYILLEVLSLQRRLMRHTLAKSTEANLIASSEEEILSLQKITTELQFHHIYDQLYVMLQKYYQFRDEKLLNKVQKIIKNPLLNNQDAATTFESIMMFHLIHADHAHLTGDAQKAKFHRQQIINTYEQHPKMKEDESLRYLNSLNNYLASCFQLNDLAEIGDVLQKIKSVIPANQEEEAQIFKSSTYLELLYYMQTNRFDDAKKLVPAIASGIKKFGKSLHKGRLLTLYYNVAVLFFVLESFDDCLSWINEIIFGEWETIRQDIQDSAKILQIIVHYELQNFELLDSLMRSTHRHLKGTNRLYDLETALMQLIKKLMRSADKKERTAAIQAAIVKVNKLTGKYDQGATGIEELLLWMQSRLTQKSITDCMIK